MVDGIRKNGRRREKGDWISGYGEVIRGSRGEGFGSDINKRKTSVEYFLFCFFVKRVA